jgi:putative membrane protein
LRFLLTPSLLTTVVLAATLYAFGSRTPLRTVRHRRWRGVAFALALVLLDLVLCPAYDRVADESLAGHMLQHVVLMSVVPPLVLLAAPWLPIWRGLPLDLRRSLARSVMKIPAPMRRSLRWLVTPAPAWLLINADMGVWHVPWLYDLTLRSTPIHYLEHVTFLLFGLFFWIPVLDSRPLHTRLGQFQRAVYVTAGAAVGWLLAVVLAFAPTPLYGAYAALANRLGGLSALGDQQLAAGVMLGIGSIPFSIAVFVFIYRWLEEEKPSRPRAARHVTNPAP